MVYLFNKGIPGNIVEIYRDFGIIIKSPLAKYLIYLIITD